MQPLLYPPYAIRFDFFYSWVPDPLEVITYDCWHKSMWLSQPTLRSRNLRYKKEGFRLTCLIQSILPLGSDFTLNIGSTKAYVYDTVLSLVLWKQSLLPTEFSSPQVINAHTKVDLYEPLSVLTQHGCWVFCWCQMGSAFITSAWFQVSHNGAAWSVTWWFLI